MSDNKTEKESKVDESQELELLKQQEKYYLDDAEDVYQQESGKDTHKDKDAPQYNVFAEFIKQLKPGIELYRISVPCFILQPISILEKVSNYSAPNSLLLE